MQAFTDLPYGHLSSMTLLLMTYSLTIISSTGDSDILRRDFQHGSGHASLPINLLLETLEAQSPHRVRPVNESYEIWEAVQDILQFLAWAESSFTVVFARELSAESFTQEASQIKASALKLSFHTEAGTQVLFLSIQSCSHSVFLTRFG